MHDKSHRRRHQPRPMQINNGRRNCLRVVGSAAVLGTVGSVLFANRAPAADASATAADGSTDVLIVRFSDAGKRLGKKRMPKVVKTDAQWRKQLSQEAYQVTRHDGTERPYSGKYWNSKADGLYRCVGCNTALYDSKTKFHSGTGWPSFWQPIARENIAENSDHRLFMTRTEISCKRCGAHLGHVFHDGPQPTGLRYCMDSVSLHFVPRSTA